VVVQRAGTAIRASFDKLRMRGFLDATKISPHPELVEGREIVLQLAKQRKLR